MKQPKAKSRRPLQPVIRRPWIRALRILDPHFKEIGELWTRLVHKLNFDPIDIEELVCVTLEAQYHTLCSTKPDDYRKALEECGQLLDRRGVPPAFAMMALSVYLENCCAVLAGHGLCDPLLVMALTQLNSLSQSLVMEGYSRQHSANWLRLVEKERRRFSQDLHDEIGHNLIVLKLYLELMARDYKKGGKAEVIEKLEEAMTLVSHSIHSVRRLILDLGPAVLEQLGLLPSFKVYAAQFAARTGIKVQVRGNDIPELPASYQTAMYRVFQGALSNVAKHSKAKAVKIMAGVIKGAVIVMTIEDDGIGFVVSQKHHPHQRFGLAAMRERIEALGGRFWMRSRRALVRGGKSGTKIVVEIPLVGATV